MAYYERYDGMIMYISRIKPASMSAHQRHIWRLMP